MNVSGKSVLVVIGFAVAVVLMGGAPAQGQAVFEIMGGNGCFGCEGAAANAPLEVRKSDGTARVLVTDTGPAAPKSMFQLDNPTGNQTIFRFNDGGAGVWDFKVTLGGFLLNLVGVGTNELVLDPSGNLTILGTLTEGSSRNIKSDFEAIDRQEILAKLTSLPVTEWSYNADNPGVRHIGPFSEDFHAAFGLNGSNNSGISSSDFQGVTLAALQGLDEKVNEELEAKNEEIARLQERLEALEAALLSLQDGR